MHEDAREERNVLPRWRPLVAVERNDLSSVGRFEKSAFKVESNQFADDIAIWKNEGGIAAASDIFDTFLVTGDRSLLRHAISLLRPHKSVIPARLKDSIIAAFRSDPDRLEIRKSIARRETDESYLRQSIRIIKKRLLNYPRDALSYLELARLYTVIGSYEKSHKNLIRALALAPDSRAILRANLQFHNIVGSLEDGLRMLRRSESLRFDPWLQSAEIATTSLMGMSSNVAKRNLVAFDRKGEIPRSSTELAMAMATLELSAGMAERKVFQLVRKALPNSTENGFAQAIWLSDNRSSRDFLMRFPEFRPSGEAFEAKVDISVKENNFEDAAIFAQFWVEDQPFSAEAIVKYLNLRSVHTSPNESSVKCAKRALSVHGDDWHVLNACVLALVEAGEFDAARRGIQRLIKEAPEGAAQAFVAAASGFLAFAEGDFIAGRLYYEQAQKIAIEFKAQNLLINATMFWLRCEAVNGLVSVDCVETMRSSIEKALGRLKHDDKDYLKSVWHSVERIVSMKSDKYQNSSGDELLTSFSSKLEQAILI